MDLLHFYVEKSDFESFRSDSTPVERKGSIERCNLSVLILTNIETHWVLSWVNSQKFYFILLLTTEAAGIWKSLFLKIWVWPFSHFFRKTDRTSSKYFLHNLTLIALKKISWPTSFSAYVTFVKLHKSSWLFFLENAKKLCYTIMIIK